MLSLNLFHGVLIMQDLTFDPVITVVTLNEEGETGALANDSTF